MIRCETHDLAPSVICCRHVESTPEGGLTREIADYIFDDYGNGFLVCSECVAAARQYVKARTDEEIEACSFAYLPDCEYCIEAALKKTKYGGFEGLRRAVGLPPES